MQYFELKMSSNVKKPINPELFLQKEFMLRFDTVDEISVGYCDTFEGYEIPDIMDKPSVMISEKLREYLFNFDDEINIKPYQIFTRQEDPKACLYYFIKPKVIDCVHRNARLLPNGEYEELIIDKTKIDDEDIFAISQVNGERLIVSKFLAEDMLVKDFYGIGLVPVKVI